MATYHLDQELRQKYPCISKMVDVANSMLTPAPQAKRMYSASEAVISNLNQDYYGIICDAAFKKQLVRSIKEFIKDSNRIKTQKSRRDKTYHVLSLRLYFDITATPLRQSHL